MDNHFKVARVHRLLSWLYALGVVVFVGILWFANRHERLPSLVWLVVVFPAAMFLLHHVIARGALERKPWARVASIVVACVMLFGFPIGTLIGIYLLANNWRPPTDRFDRLPA